MLFTWSITTTSYLPSHFTSFTTTTSTLTTDISFPVLFLSTFLFLSLYFRHSSSISSIHRQSYQESLDPSWNKSLRTDLCQNRSNFFHFVTVSSTFTSTTSFTRPSSPSVHPSSVPELPSSSSWQRPRAR